MTNIFEAEGHNWWDTSGPFAPLHQLNKTRLTFIKNYIPNKPFTALDMGCGGGLICEPLARLGGEITGVDESATAIDCAKEHAQQNGLHINYQVGSTPPPDTKYDVICALELIEHVSSPKQLLKQLLNSLKPEGVLIVSTINKTYLSWFKAILAAEYLLKWVPRGTHSWHHFLQPGQIADMIRPHRWHELKGLSYNWGNFELSDKLDTNYIGSILPNRE